MYPGGSEKSPGRPSKVVRLIDEYGLEDLGEELHRRWTTDDADERASLRELADDFNRRLLAEALADTKQQPLAGEIANLYRLLTADEVSTADRTRAERRLLHEGIDVDALRADFVSYQAIRTYLRNHRDAEYTRDPADPVTTAVNAVQGLQNRTASVAQDKVDQLINSDELSVGQSRVTVDVRVLYEKCGSWFGYAELLSRGRCDCR
jgi:hypothetical protein